MAAAAAGAPPPRLEVSLRGPFAGSLAALVALCLILLAVFADYTALDDTDEHVNRYASWLTDVYVMVFVGFGFLMSFERRYAHSAIGLTLVASALAVLEAILCVGWAQQGFGSISVDLALLIDAAFAAASAMIAFGAVLGKVSPAQLLWLVAALVPIYAATAHLTLDVLNVLDPGGSITIHAFGAFFGLAASAVLRPAGFGAAHPKNGADYVSDVTSMVGTLFLMIYWPSFNAALESAPGEAVQPQIYCILNTAISLLGSILAAFATSALIGGRLDMMHVQNATLAGGVAMGACANLRIPPAVALGVGLVAGCLSAAGFVWATPFAERRLGVSDTCGVLNLHGAPAILSALASAAFIAIFDSPENEALFAAHGGAASGTQIAGLAVTIGIALAAGAAVGAAIRGATAYAAAGKGDIELYEDSVYWLSCAREGEAGERAAAKEAEGCQA